jgi:membrane-associated protease RseP (regulator of RpoE activity)
MNLVIYLVLTLILLLTLGTPNDDLTTRISSVTKCVVPATSQTATSAKCPANARRAPAFGKLQPGDRIVAVDGARVAGWDQLVRIIQRSAGVPLHLTVERHGASRSITVTPVENRKWANAAETRTIEAGFLGVTATEHRYYRALPVGQVPGQVGSQVRQGVDALGRFPAKMSSLWGTVFEGKKRDINGPVGVVGIGRISGDFAASHQLTVKDKIYTLLGLLASVNLLLFFFNLLPLLPLDGGHVAGALVEAVRRGWARLRVRRTAAAATGSSGQRPQIFVDTAQMLPVMYAVASVLVLLTLLTLWADIVKPINPLGG